MRKISQKFVRMRWKATAILLLSFCICLPIFSKNIYIKYDPTCIDRYVYRMNGNTIGSGLVAYNLKASNGVKVMLEVGVESKRQVKVAPKGTQSCKWLSINERFARELNAGKNRVFIVRKVGGYYTVSPVHLATYIRGYDKGVYVSGNNYDFEYKEDPTGYIPNNLGGMTANSQFMYLSSTPIRCSNSYTIKRIPTETCKPTTDLLIIPEIGIIEERTDVAAFSQDKNILRLESINGVNLTQYLDRLCGTSNPPLVQNTPPATYNQPSPTPSNTGTKIIYDNTPKPTPAEVVITTQAPTATTEVLVNKSGPPVPSQYQPIGAEVLFNYEAKDVLVEKFVPDDQCTQKSAFGLHVVQRQETLFGIARRYHLNTKELMAWNNLDNAATIEPCMVLKVLPPEIPTKVVNYKRPTINCTQTNSPGIHVVQPKQTLQAIANQYGIRISDIYKWNDLNKNDPIHACALLVVEAPKATCDQISRPGIHIVQHKQTLSEIARLYNLSIAQLKEWNNIEKKDLIPACRPLVTSPPRVNVPSESAGIHIVQSGENLTLIANRYNQSIDDIRRWNQLQENDILLTGTALKVAPPASPEEFAVKSVIICNEKSSQGVHIVQSKETLTDIAKRYFITVDDIRKWNKLSNTNIIQICTPLKVAPSKKPMVKTAQSPVISCDRQSSYGVHIVQAKETLTDIAKRYFISVKELITWNKIREKDVLKVCSALKVAPPAKSSNTGRSTPKGNSSPISNCTQESSYGVHIVQAKETLTDIAKRYFISVEELITWNKIREKDVLKVCSALKVAPPAKSSNTGRSTPKGNSKPISNCDQASSYGIHVVHTKETLSDIAKRYFVSVDQLRKWNKIAKNDILQVCQVIRLTPLPTPASASSTRKGNTSKGAVSNCDQASSYGIHVVHAKETLSDIAKRYFVSIDQLRKWNKIAKNDILQVCQVIRLTPLPTPASASASSTRKGNTSKGAVSNCDQASSYGIHVVHAKETLSDIAKRYFVSIDQLRKWNKIAKNDILQVCQIIRLTPLPTPASASASSTRKGNTNKGPVSNCDQASSYGIHVVHAKETLSDIAKRYFVSVDQLRKWNKIAKNDILQVCQVIRLAPLPTPASANASSTRKGNTSKGPVSNCDQASSYGIHVVHAKETLTDIAKRYNISVADLIKWNPLTSKDIIPVCTILRVAPPQQTAKSINQGKCDKKSYPGVHIVQVRETLSEIARRYAVGVEQLRSWNNLESSDLLTRCMLLKVKPPLVNCAEKSRPGIHIVQAKENLSMIARQYNVSIADVRKWNDLDKMDIIIACTPLRVAPPAKSAFNTIPSCAEKSSYGLHVVQVKETVTEIAQRYNLTVDQINKWNRLPKGATIYPCTKLIVSPVVQGDNTSDFLVPSKKKSTNHSTNYQAKGATTNEGWLSGNCIHTVKTGETLNDIASFYGYTLARFSYINQLKDADSIQVGQQLKTGCTEEDSKAFNSSLKKSHIVKSNETLTTIAKKYQTTVENLRKLNGLEKGEIIFTDMRLYVE